MSDGFVVRRWAAWLREWEDTLCDECVEARGTVTERASNGDPTDFTDDEGQRWFWIEDKDGIYDGEEACDECGESSNSHGQRWRLLWTPENGGEQEVIEHEIESEHEAAYLQRQYAIVYGGTVEIEEEE